MDSLNICTYLYVYIYTYNVIHKFLTCDCENANTKCNMCPASFFVLHLFYAFDIAFVIQRKL